MLFISAQGRSWASHALIVRNASTVSTFCVVWQAACRRCVPECVLACTACMSPGRDHVSLSSRGRACLCGPILLLELAQPCEAVHERWGARPAAGSTARHQQTAIVDDIQHPAVLFRLALVRNTAFLTSAVEKSSFPTKPKNFASAGKGHRACLFPTTLGQQWSGAHGQKFTTQSQCCGTDPGRNTRAAESSWA